MGVGMGFAVERQGAICVARWDNPPRDFLTARMLHELLRLVDTLERDPTARVMVLTGAGPGRYVLHLDVDELASMTGGVPAIPGPLRGGVAWLAAASARALGRSPRLTRLLLSSDREGAMRRTAWLAGAVLTDRLERSDLVTVAAISGPCVGGGLEVSMAFDLRLMARGPDVVIGQPEVLCGFLPGLGGTARISRLLGHPHALELLLTGDLVGADRAAAIGWVHRAVDPGELEVQAMALATRLARRSPGAVRAIKRALHDARGRTLLGALQAELRELTGVIRSPEARAALADYAALVSDDLARPEGARRDLREILAEVDG